MPPPSNNLAIRLLIAAEDRASRVLQAVGGRVTQLGAAIAAYFTGRALANYFDSAVDSAGALQQQLSVLQQTSGASADEMLALKVAAEAVADSPLPYTAAQAAAGQIELARAGQTAQEVIASLPPVLNLASAAQLEVSESAGYVTKNLGAFGLAAGEAARVADVLVAGANLSNTSVKGLADALSYAAPMAAAAGYSIEQTTTAIGVMANAGIEGSRAGTALNSILTQLQDPSSKASESLSAMGVTSRDLSLVLKELVGGTGKAEKAILAFGMEAGPALRTTLAGGGQGVDNLSDKIAGMSGEAARAAAAMQDNLFGAFEELGSLWESIKTKVGESLLGPLEREIRSVSASLRAWVQSGQLERFRASIVSAFEAAVAAAKQFVGSFDLAAVAQNLADFASRAGAALDGARAKIEAVGEASARVVAAVSGIWNGFRGTVELVGAAFATLAEMVLTAYASIVEGANKVGLAQDQTALKARAAAETAGQAWADYRAAAEQHYSAAGDAFARMVGAQETGAQTMAANAQTAAQSIGITADELNALGASANFAAAGQAALTTATQAAVPVAEAHAAATTKSATAAQTEARAKAESARRLQEESEARRIAIEAAEVELNIRRGSVGLIQAEGQARVQHMENLREEALARGDLSAAYRLSNRIARESIYAAEDLAAAKHKEADAAEALALALQRQAQAEKDTSLETRQAISDSEQAARAKRLEADAAQEAVRHERALAAAAREVADATSRSADEAERDAGARQDGADAERAKAANKQAAAGAWGAYWDPRNIATEIDKRTGGDVSQRDRALRDLLAAMMRKGTGVTGTFRDDKFAAVKDIWAEQDAAAARDRTRRDDRPRPAPVERAPAQPTPIRTVRVQLLTGGKTTNLDLPEGQDEDLLDAIRRSGLASR
jgi:TP901 family phage tail tape measure protein